MRGQGTRQAAVALALVVAACATEVGEPEVSATAPPAPEAVAIGALYPMSGSAALAGRRVLNGVQLAAEIVNGEFPDLDPLPLAATAGLPSLDGAPIEIIIGDSEGDPETGAAETERLITEEGVVAMVGAYESSVTADGSEQAERLGIPWVTGASSAAALTEDRNLQYFFRTGPNDRTFVSTLFAFLEDLEKRDGTRLRNIGILHEDTAFGTGAARVTHQLADTFGFTVVSDVEHGNGVADVTAQAQQVMSADPDVLFQASYTPEAILFTQAWEANDYAAPTLAFGAGFADPAYFEAVGAGGDDIITRAAWSLGAIADRARAVAVAQLYEERFGTPMDEDSARTFTAALTLFQAIDEAGSTDPDVIRDALRAIDVGPDETIMPWDGIRFDSSGQNELARGVVLQYQDGAYRVVWPFDLAEAELVWPIPPPSARP